MQRTLPWLLACCLFFARPLSAGEITFHSLPLSTLSVTPSQPDVPLLLFSAVSDTAAVISAVTVTYTGDHDTDIAGSSVALYFDADGDPATPDRTTLASGGSFSSKKAVFTGLSGSVDPGIPRYFLVTSNISGTPGEGDEVSAAVSLPEDIAAGEAAVAGSFPLSGPAHLIPHIVHPAVRVKVTSIDKKNPVAGETVHFTVSALDSGGNVVTNHAGSVLSLGGAAEAPPGASPSGAAPLYSGGGAWGETDLGVKHCTYTLFKAESGRKIAVSDDKLEDDSIDAVTVSAAPPSSAALGKVPAQTAGVPFSAVLSAKDAYGNPAPFPRGTVTALSAGQNIGSSPGGFEPEFPAAAACTWTGTEAGGEKTFSGITIYSQCSRAKLKAATPLGDVLSGEFDVASGALAKYALSGPSSARLQTKTTYSFGAQDSWGNPLPGYSGTALVSCSDGKSLIPSRAAVTGGSGVLDVIFRTWGSHTLTVKDQARTGVTGSIVVLVNQPPAVAQFTVQTPSRVSGGEPFVATITALDDTGARVESYDGQVTVSVPPPASLFPGTVQLSKGDWSGTLRITGETLEAKIIVSDGTVTTVSSQPFTVTVQGFQQARAYPTVFSPRREPLRIRYYLREDSAVKIRIYNAFFDMVREISVPFRDIGGRQGLNVVEWDGKGGDAGETGRSGAYHILIDKGYEKEWTEAVIKNF